MTNMLSETLEAIGLTEGEAKTYLALLELGETSVIRVSEKSGLKRPTTYLILEGLKQKGLVSLVKKQKKTFFLAEDPRKLAEILEERKQKVARVMPELLSLASFIDRKPTIKYFEGMAGIKEVFFDTLQYPGQEMLSFFSETYAEHLGHDFFEDYYYEQRRKKRIFVRAILPDQPLIRDITSHNMEHLRRSKIVPKEMNYGINIEIGLYGGKTAIISYEEKFGLIIESEKIYSSLKNIFELLWKLLPEEKIFKKT